MQNYLFSHFSRGETAKDHTTVIKKKKLLYMIISISILQGSPTHQVDDVPPMHQYSQMYLHTFGTIKVVGFSLYVMHCYATTFWY